MAENNDSINSVDDEKKLEDERSTENNANNIRNAADVAIASKNPYAMAAGAAVKAADKITGGKSTEMAAKGMTRANKMAPGGRNVQNMSNKLSESGTSDKIGEAARIKNRVSEGSGASSGTEAASKASDAYDKMQKASNTADNTADKVNKAKKASKDASGGEQSSSLPSSRSNNESTEDGEKKGKGIASFLAKHVLVSVLILFLPFILVIVILFGAVGMVSGVFGEFDDAFGMSAVLGDETGDLEYDAASSEQKQFYETINNVKMSYQAQGKSVDAMKLVSIYHVLKSNGADIDYDNVSEGTIRSWADAMLSNNVYNEETFKTNFINSIVPSYLPKTSNDEREEMFKEVSDYIDQYNEFVGRVDTGTGTCGSLGSCTYDIKGFSSGGNNIVRNISVSNLKVRLMQCAPPYGTGSYSTPVSNELVDFEMYVAGVAYAEVGDGAPIEQYKTQMVAARSFALSRPDSMGNSRSLKLDQENGQWVLQISSCVADQVYCNIDKGCHDEGGGSEGGYTVDGDDPSAWYHKPALPEGHDIRKAAEATQGEVLVNSQGYIINTGYLMEEQNYWASLAKQGLDYKQILMKTYGSGGLRSSGATDLKKASCSGSAGVCVSNGEYAKWRQGDEQWGSVPMGNSGQNIRQIGCLVTSVSMLIAKSGVKTNINPFNPGTFVEFLNKNGGFGSGGNFIWASTSNVAPDFVFQDRVYLSGLSKDEKINKIKELVSQKNIYVVAEVKGNTGQHWVAIDSVSGSTINMMDPASDSTDMWSQYNWENTSTLAYYKVG